MCPQTAQPFLFHIPQLFAAFFPNLGQMREVDESCNRQKEKRNEKVGHLDGIRLRNTVGIKFRRAHGRRLGMSHSRENECGPNNRRNDAPTELNDCARFRRRSELSGGPRVVTYGFAATSRTPCPHAITKSANRKNPYKRTDAAGIKRMVP